MKQRTVLAVGVVGLTVLFCAVFLGRAQGKGGAQKTEAAMIKWDGGDTVQVMMPGKSEVIHVWQAGGQRQKDIPDEEYCVTWVANKLAEEGWELVNLNNRRILMRRPVVH